MACVQWVYANGSNWVALDKTAQSDIEILWSRNNSCYIRFPTVSRAAVFVDFQRMVMLCNGYAYTIARCIS